MAEVTKNVSEASKVVITSVKPYLAVEAPKANDAIKFYKSAFGAEENWRLSHTKRKADQEEPLVHLAELKLGHMVFLVSDHTDDSLVKAATVHVFSVEAEDVEAAVAQSVAAGGIAEGEIKEGAGGAGRVGKVKDPYGNLWIIAAPSKKDDEVAA